jgi:hypothetical protein
MGVDLIDTGEAAIVTELLQEVVRSRGAPKTMRRVAAGYAKTVTPGIQEADLHAVADLLRQASMHPRVRLGCRHQADYWSVCLAGRLPIAAEADAGIATGVPGSRRPRLGK